MMQEEKVDRVAVALAMFGYVNYYYGAKHGERASKRKDDIISEALDKLATDLEGKYGGKVEVMKIDLNKILDKDDKTQEQ